ncbi:MAG: FAD-dependent oxidoreductase [Candidatus Endonucleobacter sp. (ex Gigantidas childressi)]|nr:FAD-dependent oxidoreductase [Candidatus Endonucleobacter sp. (ex Gigantidas childressi)]
MTELINADVVVIGGGIAGLWLLRTLHNKGYKAILLENNSFGGGQTNKSQGIIHGGIKYTLSGSLTKASQCIVGMPDRWRKALNGDENLNLIDSTILSRHHYLWSPGGLNSKLTSFFASKVLRGRVELLKQNQLPDIFHHQGFKGKVYKLDEIVLDINTVIRSLISGVENKCLKVDWREDTTLTMKKNKIDYIEIKQKEAVVRLRADRYVMAAGEGTADLMRLLDVKEPIMQLRPLHMLMIKHKYSKPIFAHCIGSKFVPRITITTHAAADGSWIWYLGGEIAEKGVKYSPEKLINIAKQELKELLPWVDLEYAKWATIKVNRAEPKQNDFLRPDTAFCQAVGNSIITWPTKLALAPNLSDQVINMLETAKINPSSNTSFSLPEALLRPELSPPFWSDYFD